MNAAQGLLGLAVLGLAPLAGADAACDFYAFRDAMAREALPPVEALIAECRRAGQALPRDAEGTTLLHVAAHVGRRAAPALMERLLAEGVDPLATGRHDLTALRMAARFGCGDCIRQLLARGADVHERDPDGLALLHEAMPAVVPLLVDAGADPLARDHQGNVPLHRVWHPALLVAGANARNHAGLTPLHFAALEDSLPRIKHLLAAGADPALRSTHASHWRAPIMSRDFGPGIGLPAGATALDLARMQAKATRWNIQSHGATVARLEAVTPRRGWFR